MGEALAGVNCADDQVPWPLFGCRIDSRGLKSSRAMVAHNPSMTSITADLPGLVPGLFVTLVLSLVLSDAAARWLGVRRTVGWMLLFSLGLILSATLSPLAGAGPSAQDGARTCDFARRWLPSLADLLGRPDVALNVLMFVPLGVAIATARFSRRKLLVLAAAFALPFAIEAAQLVVVQLYRACQTADIVDNLSGLVIGLAAGTLVSELAPAIRRPPSLGDRRASPARGG